MHKQQLSIINARHIERVNESVCKHQTS